VLRSLRLRLMSSVAEIQQSISELPAQEFYRLQDWMTERHLELLRDKDGFESPELEAEMLKAVDGPWHPLNEEFFEDIRRSWKQEA
jgi:hypothetical protein